MTIKIVGVAKINGGQSPCYGTIEILNKTTKVVYATWRLFKESGDSALASVSRNYFIGDGLYSEQDILNKITEDILTYRVGRQRIFSDIKIV